MGVKCVELTHELLEAIRDPILLPTVCANVEGVLSIDWYGRQLSRPVNYGLAVSESEVALWAWRQQAAFLSIEAKAGDFVKGLWNQDVVELFADLDSEGAYTEINLSPQGAWWVQNFVGYREPDHAKANSCFSSLAQCFSLVQEEGWYVSAIFPKGLVFGDIVSGVNICAIIHSVSGVEHYLSVGTPAYECLPDFHRLDLRRSRALR